MGSVCAGHGVVMLPDPSKSRIALSYKLDQGSPICAEPVESFYSYYYLHSEIIGIGSVSQVSVCSSIMKSKQRAVKIISKLSLPVHIITTGALHSNFSKLKSIKSENLLKLYDIFESKDSYYIVSEYPKQGNLQDLVDSSPLRESKVRKILSQLLNALISLESQNIKIIGFRPENILFTDLTTLQLKLNVLRTHFNESEKDPSHFISPESQASRATDKSGSWSLGMIALYTLTGKSNLLHQGKVDQDTWDMLSEESKNFIMPLIDPNYEKRLSLSQIPPNNWLGNNLN